VPSSRPETRFLDILDNIRLIQGYVAGMDRVAFDADRRTRDAAAKLGPQADEQAAELKVERLNS